MFYDKRFENYRAIYYHKKVNALDMMFRDVLLAADPFFDFLTCI